MQEWFEFIKNVRPLKKNNITQQSSAKIKIRTRSESYISVNEPPNGIDGATQKKFVKEKFDIQATLDLHGYTYDTAFNKVISFIKTSYTQQKRCILIITGKGEVLRQALPKWLENKEVKNLILQTKNPSQALGGSGAFMLLIRRKRSS